MKKEALKAVTMVGLIIALAFLTATVTAQTVGGNSLRAKIPFRFNVGKSTLAAGSYSIAQFDGSILIKSARGKAGAVSLTNPKSGKASDARARLVFHKYGESYYLAEVWDGSGDGQQLRKSDAERATEREASQIAQAQVQPEIVTIFAAE